MCRVGGRGVPSIQLSNFSSGRKDFEKFEKLADLGEIIFKMHVYCLAQQIRTI